MSDQKNILYINQHKMDISIRSQAIASGLEHETSAIKIVPELMRRIEQHNDISGSVRKEVVMIALQLIKARVPPERAEEIEMLIGLASDLIESVIMFTKAVRHIAKSSRGCLPRK